MCLKIQLFFLLFVLLCVFFYSNGVDYLGDVKDCGLFIEEGAKKSRIDSKYLNLKNPVILNQQLRRTFKFARHHVIPYSRIKEFFNLVLRANDDILINVCNSLYDIMQVIMQFISKNDIFDNIHIGNIRSNFIAQLILTTTKEERKKLVNKLHNEKDLARHIHRFFVWFPANIFIGPADRSDDPGDDFEINAKYVIGNESYYILKQINDLMVSYASGTTIREERYPLIDQVVNLFHQLLSYSFTPFNQQNWALTGNIRGIDQYHIVHTYLGKYYKTHATEIPPKTELRRKRHFDINKTCLYEEGEKLVKSMLGYNCTAHLPQCGCF